MAASKSTALLSPPVVEARPEFTADRRQELYQRAIDAQAVLAWASKTFWDIDGIDGRTETLGAACALDMVCAELKRIGELLDETLPVASAEHPVAAA